MLFQRRKMTSLTKQRGAAIIIALFVVALVAIAAAIMIERLRTDIRRTELILNANKAYFYAQGSVLWAMDQLNNDWKQKQPNQIIDKTPIKSTTNKENGATISSTIYDAQGRFNINNLTEPSYLGQFTRLLQSIAPEFDGGKAQNIAFAIFDWITPTANDPTINEYYLKSNPSYRAPHRPMASISELRLVRGMTPELYEKLLPLMIALPKNGPVNVNNAEAPVIMGLSQTMSLDAAKTIQNMREKTPFPTTETFLNLDIVKNNPIEANKITVTSNYFLVETNVKLGQQNLILYTMLERIAQGDQSKTLVLWQSKGTL